MNWYSIFYWFSVVENISGGAGAVSIISGIIFVVTMMILLTGDFNDGYKDDLRARKLLQKTRTVSLILFFVLGTFWMFVPSKKDMMLIIAGGSVGTFIQGDSSIQKLPADVTRYLHLSMKKEMEDLSSETKEELGIATPKDRLLNKAKELSKEELINFIKTDSTILK